MGVYETGDDSASLQVDDAGVISGESLDVSRGPDGCDLVARYGNGLGIRTRRIPGPYLASGQPFSYLSALDPLQGCPVCILSLQRT